MYHTTSGVLFAASLGAALAAQGPSDSVPSADATSAPASAGTTTPLDGAPQPDALGRPSDLLRELRLAQQDPDYSLRALFQQAHGDFMLAHERFDPMIELSAGALPNGNVSSEPGDFDLFTLGADVDVPVMIAPDSFLRFGTFFGSRHYQTKGMGSSFGDETLYDAGVHVGLGWFVTDDVLLELDLRPGFWSDWDGTLHHQDFDLPASALATVRYSEQLFFKLGARYNEVYEDANLLPWVGVSWTNEFVRFDLMLPESLELSLWPSPDFGVLFGAEARGAEYHVRGPVGSGKPRNDIRVQELLVYTGATWRFSDYTSLQVRGGAAVAGDYKVDDGTNALPSITGTLDPSFFVDVTFGIDF
ncbi:MAG: hypothetical protein AB7O97_00315 [Planctomycetota bacterium]